MLALTLESFRSEKSEESRDSPTRLHVFTVNRKASRNKHKKMSSLNKNTDLLEMFDR